MMMILRLEKVAIKLNCAANQQQRIFRPQQPHSPSTRYVLERLGVYVTLNRPVR